MSKKILDPSGFGEKVYNKFPSLYRTADADVKYALKRYLHAIGEGGYKYIIEETNRLLTLYDHEKMDMSIMPYIFESFGLPIFNGLPELYLRNLLPLIGELFERKGSREVVEYLTTVVSNVKSTVEIVKEKDYGGVLGSMTLGKGILGNRGNGKGVIITLELDYGASDLDLPNEEQIKRIIKEFIPFFCFVTVIYLFVYYDDANFFGRDTQATDYITDVKTENESGLFGYDTVLDVFAQEYEEGATFRQDGWFELTSAVFDEAIFGKAIFGYSSREHNAIFDEAIFGEAIFGTAYKYIKDGDLYFDKITLLTVADRASIEESEEDVIAVKEDIVEVSKNISTNDIVRNAVKLADQERTTLRKDERYDSNAIFNEAMFGHAIFSESRKNNAIFDSAIFGKAVFGNSSIGAFENDDHRDRIHTLKSDRVSFVDSESDNYTIVQKYVDKNTISFSDTEKSVRIGGGQDRVTLEGVGYLPDGSAIFNEGQPLGRMILGKNLPYTEMDYFEDKITYLTNVV